MKSDFILDHRVRASIRGTTPSDDPALASLLDVSYRETIDFDPEADHLDEIRTWREVDGGDDRSSFVATDASDLVGASLIGRDLGAPLVYEIVVHPQARRSRVAADLLAASLAHLATEPMIAAWVTDGNLASESLLQRIGFWPSTDPLDRTHALSIYRAAAAIPPLADRPPEAIWAGGSADRPNLWIIGAPGESTWAEVRGTTVIVHRVGPEDPLLASAARATTPITGAALHRAARDRSSADAG